MSPRQSWVTQILTSWHLNRIAKPSYLQEMHIPRYLEEGNDIFGRLLVGQYSYFWNSLWLGHTLLYAYHLWV